MNLHRIGMNTLQQKRTGSKGRMGWMALWLVIVVLGWTHVAQAQLDTGSISGVVTDPAGKVVPGVKIQALEKSTGAAFATVSSSTGYYTIPSVRTGTYQLTATAPNFKTTVLDGITVAVGVRRAQDVRLEVGAATENVSVTAGAIALEAESSDVDTSIQPAQVEDLPLQVTGNLRSLSTLEFLVPGAVGPGTSPGGSPFQMTKINGGQEEGTDYLVDGITTNRQENGSGSFDIVAPSVEAVNEFHISISGLPAELGRTTGGLANFNTKSGTNNYHGVFYNFYKNAALDANNWFNNGYLSTATNPVIRTSLQRPADTKNDFGATMGGPIRVPHLYDGRNKSFFFFSWEQLRYNTGSAITSLIPTPAMLGSNGSYMDFTSALGPQIFNSNGTPATDACNSKLYYGEIFDPATEKNGCRTPFYDNGQLNEIPLSRLSKVASNVIGYLPAPNLTGPGPNNFVFDTQDQLAQTVYSIRLDENLTANHTIWAFFDSRQNTDQGNGMNLPSPLTSGGGVASNQLGKLFRFGWDWIVSPTKVNSLTFGTNRSNNYSLSRAAETGTNWDSKLAIPNGTGPVFPGFEFIGSPYPSFGENSDAQDVDNVIAINDIFHWQHGAHSIKFGGEAQYHQYSFVSKIGGTCSGTSGCFTFYDNQTASDTTYWGLDGNSFAAFMVGLSATANALSQLHSPRWITHYSALFAQDDWKVNTSLSLNLGLRWSVDTPRHEADGDTSIMSPLVANAAANGIPGALVFAGHGAGRNGDVGETWANVYYKDIEPRVGFAWQPPIFHDKDVLRGSGGIYYGPLVYADFGQGTMQGFTVNQTLFSADPLDGPEVDAGLPLLPNTPDVNPTQLNGQGVDYIAPSYGRPAMVETWTMENQYQITPDLFFTLGYLGMHSTRLHGLIDFPNDIGLSGLPLGNALLQPVQSNTAGVKAPYANFYQTWGPGVTVQQALRPFPQYGYINTDSYLQNVGQSTYEALEAKLERRFQNGFNVLASYTFSKTLTDADAIQPFYSTLQNQGGTQNPYDHKAEKAVSNEDIPNNFVVSYLYELPVGRGRKFLGNVPRAVNAVIGDWRISGVQRYMSGQPISFFGGTGIPGFDNGIRPNRVVGQAVKASSGNYNPFNFVNSGTFGPGSGSCTTGFWNCSAFSDPNSGPNRGTGAWTFGDMPRNSASIRGFEFFDEDFGINKTIPIHNQVQAEFRGEMFNAFNRHIFNKPDSGIQDDSFGQIGSTLNGPRNIQFVLKIIY